MTKEEYLKLIQEAYSQDDEYLDDYIEVKAWIPSEMDPALKKKIDKKVMGGNIDATNLKKTAIKKIIYTHQQITVGKFMIIAAHNTSIDTFKLTVYERVYKTASGLPCNMQNKVNINKDNRFNGRSWAKEFNSTWGAKSISPTDYVDIVKWLQAITKLTCFL